MPHPQSLKTRRCGSPLNNRVGGVVGRYWAMDRDNRWERTERAWRAILLGKGRRPRGQGNAHRKQEDHGGERE